MREPTPIRFATSVKLGENNTFRRILPTVSVVTIFGILGVFDPASILVIGSILGAILWGLIALSRSGVGDAVHVWVAGFFFRIVVAIIQTGNQIVLIPNDANLYETQGKLLADFPFEDWIGRLNVISPGIRGIIALHGFIAKMSPVFRPGIYVALLSAAGSALAVAFALLVALPLCAPRRRKAVSMFLSLSPAFAFWGSQNTKEGFVCFGLSLFGYGALHSKRKFHIVAGIALCWIFRPYIGVVALGSGLAAAGYSRFLARREQSRPLLLIASFLTILTAGILNGSALAGRDLSTFSAGVVRTGGGSLDLGFLGFSGSSPIIQGVRTIFTPPPWFIPRTPFELLSVGEGAVIAVVLLATLRRLFSRVGARNFATLATFLTTFLVCAIYGIGSNIGTNVRVRTTVYPLVFALFACSVRTPKASSDGNQNSFDLNQDPALPVERKG
jgi:hypothetical protein